MAAKLNPNPKGYNVYLFECLKKNPAPTLYRVDTGFYNLKFKTSQNRNSTYI